MKRSSDFEDNHGKPPSQKARLEPGGSTASKDDACMEGRVEHEAKAEKATGREEPAPESGADAEGKGAVAAEEPEDSKPAAEDKKPAALKKEDKEEDDEALVVKVEAGAADPKEEAQEDDKASVEQAQEPSSPTASKEAAKPAPDVVRLSYPKPKNFAERLMNAMERGIASESVYWVGGGKAIALNPKEMKEAPELTEYFKAKDYSGFIRNCNRWGFQRVAHYTVLAGIVTYENSLFQKDQPHLVKHMRMDSDVQDVFAKHQSTGDTDGEPGEDKAARIIAEAKALRGPSRANRRNRGKSEGAQPKEDQQPQSKLNPEVVAAAVAALKDAGGQQPSDESSISKEFLLRKILQLTDQFLDHAGHLYSDDTSFTTTMQLVRALGKQHQQDLATKGHLAGLLRLEASLQPQATATAKAAPAPPPPPPPSSTPTKPVAAERPVLSQQGLTRSIIDQLQQLIQNQQAPTAPTGMDAMEALLRSNILRQGQGMQRQQPQQQQPQQQLQQQPPAAAPVGPQQQLLQLLQQPTGAPMGPQQQVINRLIQMQQQGLRFPPQPQPQPQQQPQQQNLTEVLLSAVPQAAPQEETKRPEAVDAANDQSGQFTSAQELLMRVMQQNNQHQNR